MGCGGKAIHNIKMFRRLPSLNLFHNLSLQQWLNRESRTPTRLWSGHSDLQVRELLLPVPIPVSVGPITQSSRTIAAGTEPRPKITTTGPTRSTIVWATLAAMIHLSHAMMLGTGRTQLGRRLAM